MINSIQVLQDYVTSDHLPVSMDIVSAVAVLGPSQTTSNKRDHCFFNWSKADSYVVSAVAVLGPSQTTSNKRDHCFFNWSKADSYDIDNYKRNTEKYLSKAHLNYFLLSCKNSSCKDASQIASIAT